MKQISILLFTITFLLTACQPETATNKKSKKDSKGSLLSATTKKETPYVDTSLYEAFTMQEGDTTYLMKKYFICFLKEGPNRKQEEAEAKKIQAAHRAHLEKLATDKHICMAGPFDDDSDIQGIVIYSVPKLEDAQRLANDDPAVKAGRLKVELHPWWAAVGSELF